MERPDLGATEVPDPVPSEPEPDFEDGRDEEGAAEPARLAAAKAAVEEELAHARGSAQDLKEALGKRLPVDSEVAAYAYLSFNGDGVHSMAGGSGNCPQGHSLWLLTNAMLAW